jgi:type I restriction enzyme S subunit
LGEVIKLTSGKTKPNELFDEPFNKNIFPVYGGNGIMGFASVYNSTGENILIGRVGEYCGITRFVNEKCWITDNALFTKEFLKDIDVKFLSYKLQLEDLSKLRNKGGQPLISQVPISIHKIVFPIFKAEQKAIASVLSTWDDAIYKIEQLITKKELRKKWIMQQLLTGKKRLEGFDEKWREVHIRDVAQEVSKRNKNDNQLTVLSCTKYDGLVPSLEYFGRKIFSDDVSTYKIVPKYHFAYATNHIEEGSLGYQNILDEALISPMYTVFKTDESINDDYLYKLLKSHPLVYQYQNRMEGSIDRRGGLRWDGFSIIKIKIPSIEEQTAIAQVLQAADKEISLLRAKADKLREQKKGLMQMLLTGKKRLKIIII